MEPFSERNEFDVPASAEITKRNEAPAELRSVVLEVAYEAGLAPAEVRQALCSILLKRPDQNNWSRPNVMEENLALIDNCEWYFVYDLIERIVDILYKRSEPESANSFSKKVNRYFARQGIGWELDNGSIVFRGGDDFEATIKKAQTDLVAVGSGTAAGELIESRRDLSRRPAPDITGSIQHAMAAVECLLRTVSNEPKSTLGSVLSKHKDLLPETLRTSLEKAWGFSSEMARHIREGHVPSLPQAEFVVGFSGLMCSYIARTLLS